MEEAVSPKSAEGGSNAQTAVPRMMLTTEANRNFTLGTITQGQSSRWGGLWHEFLEPHGPKEASSLSATTTSIITVSATEGKAPAIPHAETCNTSIQTVDTDRCPAERPFRYSSA